MESFDGNLDDRMFPECMQVFYAKPPRPSGANLCVAYLLFASNHSVLA